MDIIERF